MSPRKKKIDVGKLMRVLRSKCINCENGFAFDGNRFFCLRYQSWIDPQLDCPHFTPRKKHLFPILT